MTKDKRGCVLVTGGAGYVGSHAVLALIDAGWNVVVIDNLVTGFARAVDPQAILIKADIEDDTTVRRALREHGVSAVVHFAGSVVSPDSVLSPLSYYRNNFAASASLIESIVACDVRHVVFSSTAAVYGNPARIPVKEDDPTEPITPYGTSKLMTEKMLRDVAAAHPVNYCVLRYFNVAGADPLGRAGQSTQGATHLIKVAVEAATGQRSSVEIYGSDFATADGTGVRDYVHVSDLATAHVLALDALILDPGRCRTFNVGYGRGASVLEVLDAVDRVTNAKIPRKLVDRRAGDAAKMISDNRKILSSLQWQPQHDNLQQIVRDALTWELKRTAEGS